MLPRDLAELKRSYDALVDSVSAGSLTYQDAVNALDQMAATDASGIVWRLDIEGNFLAGPAGTVPLPADPYRFLERTSPGPWAGEQQSPQVAPPSSSISAPVGPLPNFQTNLPPIETKKARSRRKPTSETSGAFPDAPQAAVTFLKKFRTVLIVGVTVVAAAVIWQSNGNQQPGTELPVTNEQTETTPPTSDIETAGQESGNAEATTDTGTDQAAVATSLLAALAKGDATTSPVTISKVGTGAKELLRRAQYAGYAAVGITLKVTSVKPTDPSRSQIQFDLVDAGGAVLLSGKATMQRDGQRWLLTDWPVLG